MAILHAVIKMGYQRSRTLTNCSNRLSAFNGLPNWNVSSVTTAEGLFANSSVQWRYFQLDVSSLVTPSALAMLVGA
jgi:hypothetical protein